ncbi:unnamed protein product, partial [Wuchereria bancrofti]
MLPFYTRERKGVCSGGGAFLKFETTGLNNCVSSVLRSCERLNCMLAAYGLTVFREQMAENRLNFVDYGTNNQAIWEHHADANASIKALNNQSTQNSPWATKVPPANNLMSSQGCFFDSVAVGSNVNVLSYLQQHPNSFPVNDSVQSLLHDSSAAALTYNYPSSCSVTHHRMNSAQNNSSGQSDTIFQPQLLPNFSAAPFLST